MISIVGSTAASSSVYTSPVHCAAPSVHTPHKPPQTCLQYIFPQACFLPLISHIVGRPDVDDDAHWEQPWMDRDRAERCQLGFDGTVPVYETQFLTSPFVSLFFPYRTSLVNYKGLENKLDALQLRCLIGSELLGRSSSTTPSLSPSSESTNSSGRLSTISSSSSSPPSPTSDSNSIVRNSYEQLIQTSEELSEEDKKLLWDSLFPHFNGSSVPE